MAPKKFAFSNQRKVGPDGLTKQQRYLSNPKKYAEVKAKNRERNRQARKNKKKISILDWKNDEGETAELPEDKTLNGRYERFLMRVRIHAWHGDLTLDYLDKATVTDFRDLPPRVEQRRVAIRQTVLEGRRLLRVLSRDIKQHRELWDKTLDQIMGLNSIYDRISIARMRFRTEEDLRALEELDDDLERLEELDRQEGIYPRRTLKDLEEEVAGLQMPESDSDESIPDQHL